MIFPSGQNGGQFNFHSKNQFKRKNLRWHHITLLIVIISSVIPENLVPLTKSEQSGPKSAHISAPLFWKQLKKKGLIFVVQLPINIMRILSVQVAAIIPGFSFPTIFLSFIFRISPPRLCYFSNKMDAKNLKFSDSKT